MHTYSGELGGFWCFLRSWDRIRKPFFHKGMFIVSLHYPMWIRAIDPVCPQAILPMKATLLPFGMLCVTIIPAINCSNTLLCLELSGKDAGKRFMPLWFKLFDIHPCKVEELFVSRKFDLRPLITGRNIDLWSKAAPPIAGICRRQSAGFSASPTTLCFKTHGGRITSLPLPP